MLIDDREALEEEFLNSLKKFDRGDLPRFNEKDFLDADSELNKVYKEIQQNSSEYNLGTVSKGDIKAAQRAWLKYRDAWVAFAKQKYPSVAAFAWKTWLMRDRIKLLQ